MSCPHDWNWREAGTCPMCEDRTRECQPRDRERLAADLRATLGHLDALIEPAPEEAQGRAARLTRIALRDLHDLVADAMRRLEALERQAHGHDLRRMGRPAAEALGLEPEFSRDERSPNFPPAAPRPGGASAPEPPADDTPGTAGITPDFTLPAMLRRQAW